AALFLGVGGSLNAARVAVVILSVAVGFEAMGGLLAFVSPKAASATYSALHVHAATLTLHGIAGLTLYVSDLDVSVNTASTGAKIDWAAQGVAVTLSDTASDFAVIADFAVDLGSG